MDLIFVLSLLGNAIDMCASVMTGVVIQISPLQNESIHFTVKANATKCASLSSSESCFPKGLYIRNMNSKASEH